MDNCLVLMDDILCRLCLKEPGVENIFEPIDMSIDINKFTGVLVLRTDMLPKKVCQKCVNTINDIKELSDLAMKNDFHLRQLVNPDSERNTNLEITLQINLPHEINLANNIMFDKDNTNNLSTTTVYMENTNNESANVTRNKSISERNESFKRNVRKNDNETSQNRTKNMTERSSGSMADDDEILDCTVCSRVYSTPKKLWLHMRQHNKLFRCPIDECNKRFAIKGDLNKHIRSHTGEKPYECGICDRKFTQRGTLKVHIQKIHNS